MGNTYFFVLTLAYEIIKLLTFTKNKKTLGNDKTGI